VSALIVVRFVLKAFGADALAPFTAFIYAVTDPLVAPFHGIFAAAATGRYIFEPASLVAIVVYLLLGWAVAALVRILAPRPRVVT
jgi:uncharacterized protein YggT (Ycf19 family)